MCVANSHARSELARLQICKTSVQFGALRFLRPVAQTSEPYTDLSIYVSWSNTPALIYHIVTWFLKVMISGILDRYKYLHGTRLMLTAIPPPARSWKNFAPAGQECGAWCSGLNFQAAWMCENWPMDATSKGQ